MARPQTTVVAAEMAANVLSVDVAVGDDVEVGQTLVMLESMKMEIPVIAEVAGKVTLVGVLPGDAVQDGDVLVEVTS